MGYDSREKYNKWRRRHRKRLRENGVCTGCEKAPSVTGNYCQSCVDDHNARCRAMTQRYKRECFDAYGGATCRCCGEHRMEMLSIDHIHGGGCQHRKQKGVSALYLWLRRNNYPSGFQVLCMNCNFAKGKFGECPHVAERRNKVFYTGIHNDSPVNMSLTK